MAILGTGRPRSRSSDGQLQVIRHPERVGVFNVEHAALAAGLGLRRSVNHERAHGNDSTGRNDAVHRWNVPRELSDLCVGQHAHRVRSGKHAQRSVVGVRIVVCSRNATTRDSAVAGAWAYVIPALMDDGPQPGMSRRSRRGSAVSWCHTTSQLLVDDLSNSVARNGTASGPTKRAAIVTSRESRASCWTSGTRIKCRAPARLRSSVECWSSVATVAASDRSRTLGTISKPFVMLNDEFNDGALAMLKV